jgi:hypothetical protein
MTNNASDRLGFVALMSTALWWGSLTALGLVFVPGLFLWWPEKAVAGTFAGHLFKLHAWMSMALVVTLLVIDRIQAWKSQQLSQTGAVWSMRLALGLIVLQELWIAPHIMARDNLALWHNLGSAALLGQWALATRHLHALWRQSGATGSP